MAFLSMAGSNRAFIYEKGVGDYRTLTALLQGCRNIIEGLSFVEKEEEGRICAMQRFRPVASSNSKVVQANVQ